jgi:hypothetical protein
VSVRKHFESFESFSRPWCVPSVQLSRGPGASSPRSHGPAPWLPGRRKRRVEARAGALHNEHVDAVVSSIERFSQATGRLNHRGNGAG